MSRALFIGGYSDGYWIDVPDGYPTFQTSEYGAESVWQHLYRADSLHAGKDTWRVFVANEMTPREMMTALLENYRPTVNKGVGHE